MYNEKQPGAAGAEGTHIAVQAAASNFQSL